MHEKNRNRNSLQSEMSIQRTFLPGYGLASFGWPGNKKISISPGKRRASTKIVFVSEDLPMDDRFPSTLKWRFSVTRSPKIMIKNAGSYPEKWTLYCWALKNTLWFFSLKLEGNFSWTSFMYLTFINWLAVSLALSCDVPNDGSLKMIPCFVEVRRWVRREWTSSRTDATSTGSGGWTWSKQVLIVIVILLWRSIQQSYNSMDYLFPDNASTRSKDVRYCEYIQLGWC